MNKKILFIPILALSLVSGLMAEGFQFENNFKYPIKITIEAVLKHDNNEQNIITLKPGGVYTREDYNAITNLKVVTLKKDNTYWNKLMIFWDHLVNKNQKSNVIKELEGNWKKEMQGAKKGKIKRIRFYEDNDKLKMKSDQIEWNNKESIVGL